MTKELFSLVTAVEDKHKEKYHVSPHQHNHYELVYYIKGSGKVCMNGREHSFSPNTFSFTTPKCSHDEKSNERVHLLYIGFSINSEEIDISMLKSGVYKCPKYASISKILKTILIEKENQQEYSDDAIEQLLHYLYIIVRRIIHNTKGVSKELDSITAYIKENCCNNITGIDVARHFNYSYDHFRKMFKLYFSSSINDYINKQKVEVALSYMKKTDMSVKDIAKKCGFSSTSHFISLFKEYYLVTPKQFLLNYDKNVTR